MKTIEEILSLSIDYLEQHGVSSPRRQGETLVADALGVKRIELYMEFERPLVEAELDKCRKALIRRGKYEPLQYIYGEVDFYDCSINVTRDVLIPRQETEILVDNIAKSLAQEDLKGKILWDICCGSGCIGIALKKKLPELKVILSDISGAAISVAEKNAEKNGVDVSFFEGDLLAPFAGMKADYIVCNPPYISDSDYLDLDREVRDFEPKSALFAGETGFEFYDRLREELIDHLLPSSRVWFEVGMKQGDSLVKMFSSFPNIKNVGFDKDWSGHDRFFFLEIE